MTTISGGGGWTLNMSKALATIHMAWLWVLLLSFPSFCFTLTLRKLNWGTMGGICAVVMALCSPLSDLGRNQKASPTASQTWGLGDKPGVYEADLRCRGEIWSVVGRPGV